MSLTFKLASLVIRTAAKPIGNYIKRQTKEHDGFRRFAVKQAQRIHQIDMRMRLGLLHDADAQQRMHEREQRAAEDKKRRAESPTVRTELEQRKHDEDQAKAESPGDKKKEEEKRPRVRIRPLSDAKAIELGANFFSEAFIFAVAAGLLVWDSWRSRAKESARRDDVAERIEQLEAEVYRLRREHEPELAELKEQINRTPQYSWFNPKAWLPSAQPEEKEGGRPVAISDKSVRDMVEKGSKAEPTVPAAPVTTTGEKKIESPEGTSNAKPTAGPTDVKGSVEAEAASCLVVCDIDQNVNMAPGYFCHSLRRRQSFNAAIPELTAQSGLGLLEKTLDTHDLALPLQPLLGPITSHGLAARQLRLLLLSSSAVAEAQLEATIERVQRFASLTGGNDLAIVFLLASTPPPLAQATALITTSSFTTARRLAQQTAQLSADSERGNVDGVVAWTRLQAELTNRSDIPYIPTLPLTSLFQLAQLVRKHVAALNSPSHPAPKQSVNTFDLLQHCTSNPSMDQQIAYCMSDLFVNMAELAVACTGISSAPQSSSPSARAAARASIAAGSQVQANDLLDDPATWMSHNALSDFGDDDGRRKLKQLRDLVGEKQCMEVVDFWKEEWLI
ncbi:hypothetical protein KC367_g6968 [Hortaea werneckii]|nr:hypothetical protein KC342_g5962 [Hortaea werneckii]KAI7096975.1 hypothetical protein KC339_g10002 [Hortaea werneckii]KAI7221508.1 hypothetical protein KC365_g11691 [Hortaea werneckii]KAI7327191.1 hypothetical protein KC340_g5692 [Hortaea werneckii]KAI7403695.1 hypothetical protein KC328_g2230 [Hortaea werneckii]